MASKKTQFVQYLLGFIALVCVAAACSSSEPVEPTATPADTTQESSAGDQTSTTDDSTEAPDEPAPTSQPEPTLADQDLAAVIDLQAGEQVQDAQGNLLAIYGIAQWPDTFDALSDPAQSSFSFFGDVEAVGDPTSELVVLDVGMCAAGLDAIGFGTAEFFVQERANQVLSTDPVLNRGILTRHPVVRPGFGFPSPAECERGFLPVLWSGEQTPTVARYVLATRVDASSPVEQYVYQWQLDPLTIERSDDDLASAELNEDLFTAGQTVTFNQGRLDDTTVVIQGWAELIGTESPIDGTRLVAVSVNYCPASLQLPEFGLGVDGWNIVAPVGDGSLGALSASDPTQQCFEGWVEFAIPFGSVPTAFFASDGSNARVGYAEWSLVDAAVPAPQS